MPHSIDRSTPFPGGPDGAARYQGRAEAAEVVVDLDRAPAVGTFVELAGAYPENLRGTYIVEAAAPTVIGVGFRDREGLRLSLRRVEPEEVR